MNNGNAVAIAIGISFVIYFVWLMFLSWLVSRFMIRDGRPVMRAALCVVISVILAWAISFGLQAFMQFDPRNSVSGFGEVILQLGTPLAVFLWEWWSFQRHWIDDDDIEEIFE